MSVLNHTRKICRHKSGAVAPPVLAVAALVLGALGLTGCSSYSMPVLRSRAGDAPTTVAAGDDGADANAAECEQLRAQIRSNQQAGREAPTTSTMPIIVEAAEGRADKQIDDARQRMDELDCPSEYKGAGKPRQMVPMPPAPGAPNP